MFLFRCSFKILFSISFCIMCASIRSQIHPGCDQLHSVSLHASLGNWLSTFRHKLARTHAHTSSWKYSLIFRPLNMRPLGFLETSSNDFQETRRREHSIALSDGEGLLRESRKCRTSLRFVVTAFQIHTGKLGLHSNVNRQVMKLDLVSVFCINKRCRFRVKL